MSIWQLISTPQLIPGQTVDISVPFLSDYFLIHSTPTEPTSDVEIQPGYLQVLGTVQDGSTEPPSDLSVIAGQKNFFTNEHNVLSVPNPNLISNLSLKAHLFEWAKVSFEIKIWALEKASIPNLSMADPGDFKIYGGILDTTNPAVLATYFSGQMVNLNGQLWVVDGAEIGSSLSTAIVSDNRTEALYKAVWGRPDVTGISRGIDSSSDWAANKPLTLPQFSGRAIVPSGQGAGLTNRNLGDVWGEENHLMTHSEMCRHRHSSPSNISWMTRNYANTGTHNLPSSGGLLDYTSNDSQVTSFTGSGTPFNVCQPSVAAGKVIWALGTVA